jgi:Fe-S-cluster containining protein
MRHIVLDFVPVDHPRFRRAQRAIFTCRIVADCMTHRCRLTTLGDRLKLDACCQYGADTDLSERDAILARRDQIAPFLSEEVRDQPWFTADEIDDADFPSGGHVRTRQYQDSCVFLAHRERGCGIHRAAVAGGWDFRGVKPAVCRLFPLSYESDAIVLSDDYPDYSCAREPNAPTVYRVGRVTLGDVFGAALVVALDRVEADVEREMATPPT